MQREILALIVIAMASTGCEPTVPDERSGLMSAMADDDMSISTAAVRKMVQRYGGPGLREALTNPNGKIRAQAAHGLAFCAGSQNERALLEAASDRDEYVRNWVAYSLGQIGSLSSTNTLRELSNDSSLSVRDSAERAKAVLDARLHSQSSGGRREDLGSRIFGHVLAARSPTCARE